MTSGCIAIQLTLYCRRRARDLYSSPARGVYMRLHTHWARVEWTSRRGVRARNTRLERANEAIIKGGDAKRGWLWLYFAGVGI